jgi:hypothetical protein
MVFGEKTRVVTVCIASAEPTDPRWMACPIRLIGCRGRDTYGHDGALHPGCQKMTPTAAHLSLQASWLSSTLYASTRIWSNSSASEVGVRILREPSASIFPHVCKKVTCSPVSVIAKWSKKRATRGRRAPWDIEKRSTQLEPFYSCNRVNCIEVAF